MYGSKTESCISKVPVGIKLSEFQFGLNIAKRACDDD